MRHAHRRRAARRGLAALLALVVAPGAGAGEAPIFGISVVSTTRSSPLGECRDGPETGTNFRNSEVEPFVAIDPTNPNHVAGAYQQDRWSDGGARGVGSAFSHDGGLSWTRVPRTKTSFCTGGRVRNRGDFERATDPWVTFAPNGDLYLMTLSLNGSSNEHAMLVTKFNRAKSRWGKPKTLIREDVDFLNDKNSMTADPNEPDGSHVYAVWDRVGIEGSTAENVVPRLVLRGPTLFTRTVDGGRSWSKARVIFDPGLYAQTLGNQIGISPDLGDGTSEGQLINIFTLIVPRRNIHDASIVRSYDQGATWEAPITIDAMRTVGVIDPDPDTERRRDQIRTGALIPDIAVDPATGTIYAVWQDARFNDFAYDGIVMSASTDGGSTWSTPVEVNKTPDSGSELNRQAFTPSVAVAEDGTIGVGYYDFRNNDRSNHATLETDYWLVHCRPEPQAPCTDRESWVENAAPGSTFDMKRAPYARGYFVGDYVGLAGTSGGFIAFFTRARTKRDPATVYAALIRVI